MMSISKRKWLVVLILVSLSTVLSYFFVSESFCLPSHILLLPIESTKMKSSELVSTFYRENVSRYTSATNQLTEKQIGIETAISQQNSSLNGLSSSTITHHITISEVRLHSFPTNGYIHGM